jgi:hypothetical protein
MSESVRILCGNIMLITFTATCCLALAVGAVLGIICVVKWLRGDFKDNERF